MISLKKRLKKADDANNSAKNVIESMDDDELIELARKCSENELCKFADVFANDESAFDEIFYGSSSYDMFVVGMETHSNGDFNWDDDYVRLVNSETLESLSEKDLLSECKEHIDDIAKVAVELGLI